MSDEMIGELKALVIRQIEMERQDVTLAVELLKDCKKKR